MTLTADQITNPGAVKGAQNFVVMPDSVPDAVTTGDPLKDFSDALTAKRAAHQDKMTDVRSQLEEQRSNAVLAVKEYEDNRGRLTLLAYSGELPMDELHTSSDIAQRHRETITNVEQALPLLTADPNLKKVSDAHRHLLHAVATVKILSKRCLALAIEGQEMAAGMHFKQLENQKRANCVAIDNLVNLCATAFGEDTELAVIGEKLKTEINEL